MATAKRPEIRVTLLRRRGVIHAAVDDELDVAALSERYGPMVLRRCRQLLRNESDAWDACQDVFVRVMERRRYLDARYPSSLLYRIATNVCLNRIRDNARRPGSPCDERLEAIARAESPGGSSDARLLLDWLFNRHPPSSRVIAVLHYVDGLTLEQVAEETGLSVSGVRKRLRRLRHSLVGLEP
jgi:RNA polymerase sigma-70 factor, ECF subfamily